MVLRRSAAGAAGVGGAGVVGLTDSSRFHIVRFLPLCWKTGVRVPLVKPGEVGLRIQKCVASLPRRDEALSSPFIAEG